jgi:hypothetical protein
MTAQMGEILLIDHTEERLCALPLDVLFNAMPQRPHFILRMTAIMRGYVGTWKIEDDKLWLVRVNGYVDLLEQMLQYKAAPRENRPVEFHDSLVARLEALPRNKEGICQSSGHWSGKRIPDTNGFVDSDAASGVTLEQVMDSSEVHPLLASWYSGLLRVPRGEMLEYVHGAFLSEYERDLILEVRSGTVGKRWLVDNRPRKEAPERALRVEL